MRSGLIVKKIGMTRLYLEDGTHVPVTVLSLKDCQVVANQSLIKNGYNSVTLASGEAKPKNTNKSQREAFAKVKITPKQKQMEFRVSEENMIPIGSELSANHFVVGQYVDATGITIGKGFAGAMKRHNFGGLRASHGVSISHRSHGSTGNSQDPGRVFKGKKMAGQMGNRQRTIQNLQVVAADQDRGLIFIKGGLPGSKGSWVSLKDAVKKAVPSDAPYPAGLKGASNSTKDDNRSEVEVDDVSSDKNKVAEEVVKEEVQIEEEVKKAEAPTKKEAISKEENLDAKKQEKTEDKKEKEN
ncbi:MAG: 50S ribosomal protein L3 [Alphaproteobacteria bacterium MarineAlpha9_Bin3]|nr:MAG: 50S ribosomal protein L3 [Alphaproteobacteria bacterium MarineAlpha9_Bin3]|tara:strand:+ start:406 stop:1302 length:897 start_codon:yes stop_codon:yes gene_type:complete